MAIIKLTDKIVRRLLESGAVRDRMYFDVELPRFFLRMRPSARNGVNATYYVRFTDRAGRETRCRIGTPDTLSVSQGRQAARKVLAAVDLGGNPVKERQELRERLQLRDVVTAYRLSPAWMRKSDQTRRSDDIRLEKHILHRLGGRTVPELSAPAVRLFIEDVRQDKRVGGRKKRLGGDGSARKCLRLLSAIISWAVENGYVADHPFRGSLRLEGDGVREAAITDPSDFNKILRAMDEMVREGALSKIGAGLITVLMVTGMRRGEARDLTWSQVDLPNRSVLLQNPKGAKLSRRGTGSEIVHLPDLAIRVLAELRSEGNAPDALVFPPTRGRAMETTRLWSRVRDAAGIRADLTLHGLRHSMGTVAALQGLGLMEIRTLLRHRQTSTTERYIKSAQMALVRHVDVVAKAMTSVEANGGEKI